MATLDNDEVERGNNLVGLLRSDLANYCKASNLAFNEEIKERQKAGQQIYHLGFGQSPFPILDGAAEELPKHANKTAYLPVAGLLELRQAICRFHARYDKLDFNPDQIIVSPGSKELIFLVMQVFKGDVLLVSPGWTTYNPQSILAHHKPIILVTSIDQEWRVTPEIVEEALKEKSLSKYKILVLCNPDNPTGTCYKTEHLKALADVFRKHGIIVVSDEIYARLHYEQEHDTLARHYPEGTIISTGMSKWASAGGWRLGYHIFPPELQELRNAVHSAASHTYSCAPAPMQFTMIEVMKKEDQIHLYINHTSRIMAAIGNYCYRVLKEVGARIVKPTASYYIMPNFECLRESLKKRGIHTSQQMCRALLEEANVAVMAAGPAFLRPVEELTVRLCFVNFDGSLALKQSKVLGLDTPLPEKFIQEYCTPVYDGIQALAVWVRNQQ